LDAPFCPHCSLSLFGDGDMMTIGLDVRGYYADCAACAKRVRLDVGGNKSARGVAEFIVSANQPQSDSAKDFRPKLG